MTYLFISFGWSKLFQMCWSLNSCQVFSQWQLKLHLWRFYRSKLNYSFVDGNVWMEIAECCFRLGIKQVWLQICLCACRSGAAWTWLMPCVSMPTEASGRGKPKPSCQKVTSLPQSKLYRVSDQNESPYTVLLKGSFCFLLYF